MIKNAEACPPLSEPHRHATACFLASPTTAPFWKQKFLLDVPGLLRIETNWNKFFYFYYYYELQ